MISYWYTGFVECAWRSVMELCPLEQKRIIPHSLVTFHENNLGDRIQDSPFISYQVIWNLLSSDLSQSLIYPNLDWLSDITDFLYDTDWFVYPFRLRHFKPAPRIIKSYCSLSRMNFDTLWKQRVRCGVTPMMENRIVCRSGSGAAFNTQGSKTNEWSA